jgi:mRNA-degrading endonuclease RelE of RelBE toxin-antitoxin system
MYSISIKKSAYESLDAFKPQARRSIIDLIAGLRQSPLSRRRGEVAKIRDYDSLYRITTLTARVTYEIKWEEKTIIVQLVEPRT